MTVKKVDGHEIEISNPDKLMFPGTEVTKKDLIEYYEKIADHMLPFLKDRPLMMHRYPNGIDGKDFYQKEVPDHFPGWINTIQVKLKGNKGHQTLVNCNSKAALIYVANQATITPHIWLSQKQNIDRPEKIVFDLDPPEDDFSLVIKGATEIGALFDRLDLKVFPMTSGSQGIHVVLPLDGSEHFDKAREFAKKIANRLAEEFPDQFTTETRKNKRDGRLFIDYLRNAYGQTSVAPYALRARKGAPVATPLSWDELSKKGLSAKSYHIKNIFRRLAAKQDPWKDFHKNRVEVSAAEKMYEQGFN